MLRLIRRSRFVLASAALVALAWVGASALSAHADEPSQPSSASGQVAWSMTPVITDVGEERSNFVYALEPGASADDAVLVRNSGAVPLDLAVNGSDAFTDGAGALDIVTENAAAGAGSWISPATDGVHIEPGELVRIPFRVSVPADAQPGEHAAALLTVLANDGETVSVDMRYATRVTVTVAGELTAGIALDAPALNVTTGFWPWEPATAEVSYEVRNTGNTRLTALQLIAGSGIDVYSAAEATNGLVTLAELLPDSLVAVDAAVEMGSSWSPFTALQVSVSPSVLPSAATSSAEQPTVDQERVELSAVTIAPGWWVMVASLLLVALVIVQRVRAATRR